MLPSLVVADLKKARRRRSLGTVPPLEAASGSGLLTRILKRAAFDSS
jgi:hypothetical protein